MYGYRGGAGFLPPTEERRGILVFFVLQISSRHQLLPEDQIHHRFDPVLLIVFLACFTLHLHTSEHEENELHGSRRALHCKLHATLTLHYMQHYTLHYTQHYRLAARGSTSGQDRKATCILISLFKSLKAPKCCPCQQFGSVACSVACSVAWSCHATLVTFTGFLEKDSASSLSSWSSNHFPECQRCFAQLVLQLWSNRDALGSTPFDDLTSSCIWPKLPLVSARCFFAGLHPGTCNFST